MQSKLNIEGSEDSSSQLDNVNGEISYYRLVKQNSQWGQRKKNCENGSITNVKKQKVRIREWDASLNSFGNGRTEWLHGSQCSSVSVTRGRSNDGDITCIEKQ
jgi:hypothetical protein